MTNEIGRKAILREPGQEEVEVLIIGYKDSKYSHHVQYEDGNRDRVKECYLTLIDVEPFNPEDIDTWEISTEKRIVHPSGLEIVACNGSLGLQIVFILNGEIITVEYVSLDKRELSEKMEQYRSVWHVKT